MVGHLIGDWIVQTDHQAMNKKSSWKANQQHMPFSRWRMSSARWEKFNGHA